MKTNCAACRSAFRATSPLLNVVCNCRLGKGRKAHIFTVHCMRKRQNPRIVRGERRKNMNKHFLALFSLFLVFLSFGLTKNQETDIQAIQTTPADSLQTNNKISQLVGFTAGDSFNITALKKFSKKQDTCIYVDLTLFSNKSSRKYVAGFGQQYKPFAFKEKGFKISGSDTTPPATVLDSLLAICDNIATTTNISKHEFIYCKSFKEYYLLCFNNLPQSEINNYPTNKADGSFIMLLDPYINFIILKSNLKLLCIFSG